MSFNFSLLFLLVLSAVVVSCGVKGPPRHPDGTGYKQWVEKYIPPETAPVSVDEQEEKKDGTDSSDGKQSR